jgi:DtxR family Mn-dependent transcriptional regulator
VTDTGERVFSQAVEDYVKAIYKLQRQHEVVSTNVLAKQMRTSPAAATKMIKNLSSLRLAEHTPYYGVRLTPAGEKVALEVIRHHRLLELYLHQALGYSWDEVDAEAEKLEHHISEEFEERIDRMLDYPHTDPHGDPIPTRDGTIAPDRGKPLSDSEPGDTLIVRRVRDSNPEVLRYLTRMGMGLQSVVAVMEKQPFNGPLTVEVDGKTHTLGRELAGHVFVESYEPQEELSG